MNYHSKDKLFTSSYILACVGNFLLFFGFYLLMPILPLYLIETFGLSKATIGLILSGYVIATLFVRPFTAFFADLFNRKPLYIIAYFAFIIFFIGYPLVTTVGLFVLVRILHGLAFGAVTTTGNTLIVDIMPSSRRGEGLGYFGMANNIAMAFGPMTGLFLHDYTHGFSWIFYGAILSGGIGFICASFIKSPIKEKFVKEERLSLDRFFLPKGVLASVCLFLLAIPYSITATYIALYGAELGIRNGMGIFFSLLAVGMIASRFFAGRLVDQGKLTNVIFIGSLLCTVTFLLFSGLKEASLINHVLLLVLFYFVALIMGVGYGMMFPAYNTLFVNLAPHNRRATASSTYLTSWDIGVGIGLVLGGHVSEYVGFPTSYLVSCALTLISTIVFKKWTEPHFNKNKLR